MRMDKDDTEDTRWCQCPSFEERNPARSNATMPRARSARKSGRRQMLTQQLLRGVRQARAG